MSVVMPNARTLLRALAPVLVLAVFAPPAHAWQVPVARDTGGVEVLPDTIGDDGGAPAGDPSVWPGHDSAIPPPAPGLLGGLPGVPGLLPQPEPLPLAPVTTTTVAGKVARLRSDGRAAIPRGAPKRVRSLISQYNRIVGRSYRWGGGHAVVEDRAFDCSGAVGYGLIKTGMLDTTMLSGSFARWAAGGPGRWVTIYANRSHVYTEVAGLRLDTSSYGEDDGANGVRWRPLIGQRTGFKVRHPVGL